MIFHLHKIFDKLHHLFVPHHHNNFRAKLLHHKSLSKLILLLILSQLVISVITKTKPEILGYASNITVADIISLTNSERQKEGLATLKFNETLANSAAKKAAHMFANNYWAHTAPDGTSPWEFFKQANYNYLYAGENLARDFADSEGVTQAWMASPTHKENIISGRYDEIGVAVVNGILNGQETTLVVQHFGKQSSVQATISDESASSIQGETVKQPEIAYQEKNVEEVVGDIKKDLETKPSNLFQTSQLANAKSADKIPTRSAFDLTKSINLAIALIIILALVLDGYIIYKNKQERRVGKNFVHLTLIVIVVIIILITKNGRII